MLDELAAISPSPLTQPFWDACKQRELRLQRCTACGRFRQPPLPGCKFCGAAKSEWALLPGTGRVFSFTVVHHPAVPFLKAEVPYVIAVIELDGAPDARLISNLVEVAPEDVAIGQAVQVHWDEVSPDVVLPRFRPTA